MKNKIIKGQWDLTEREHHTTYEHQTNHWNQVIFNLEKEMTWYQYSGEVTSISTDKYMSRRSTNKW
jgi:hypothetical protein